MQPDPVAIDRLPNAKPPAPDRIKRRADFLRVGRGQRWHGVAMTIQAAARPVVSGNGDDTRFGFTLTKKVGNAVVRNRARRRLREAVRLADDLPTEAGRDYVIVGRIAALRLPFAALQAELAHGLAAVHRAGRSPKNRRVGATDQATASGRAAPERTRPKP